MSLRVQPAAIGMTGDGEGAGVGALPALRSLDGRIRGGNAMPVASKTKRKTAQDPTRSFFDDLVARGPEPLLRNASGAVRFDLVDGRRVEHWYVSIDQGDVTVSHENADADTVLRTDRSLFDRIVSGRTNAMAAVLRGELVPEGNLSLLMVFQRLLPGPPRSRARRTTDGRERSRR
jgi:hypothetical protein